MTVKFHEKNVAVLGKVQTVEGTAVNPAATDILPIITNDSEIVRETEQFQFLGDSLDREENTTVKDTYSNVKIQTLMPVLGVVNGARTEAEGPLRQWFGAVKAKAFAAGDSDGTFDNSGSPLTLTDGEVVVVTNDGSICYTNSVANNELLTIDYIKSSDEATAGKQKRYRYYDARGSVDFSFTASEKVKLDFNYMCNFSTPTMETAVTFDYGNQRTYIAANVRKDNMIKSIIQAYPTAALTELTIIAIDDSAGTITVQTSAAHSLTTGDYVNIYGTTSFNEADKQITVTAADTFTYTSSLTGAAETSGTVTVTDTDSSTNGLCINNLNVPNLFGFEYSRFLLTCQEGFDVGAIPTDVTCTILEDEVGGTDFDPEANLENFFKLKFHYGTGAGKNVKLILDRLQLANVKDTKISKYWGKEISFRNVGKAFLIFE